MSTLSEYLSGIAGAIKEKKKLPADSKINAQNFREEILSIENTDAVSLNVGYDTTPPEDRSKLWFSCRVPDSFQIEPSHDMGFKINSHDSWDIDFAFTKSKLTTYYGEYTCCHMEDYKIIMITKKYIVIYDLKNRDYLRIPDDENGNPVLDPDFGDNILRYKLDYASVNGENDELDTSELNYIQSLYKDGVVYFMKLTRFYKYNFNTKTLEKIFDFLDSDEDTPGKYLVSIFMSFYKEKYIDFFAVSSRNGNADVNYRYRYNILTGTLSRVKKFDPSITTTYGSFLHLKYGSAITAGNYLYDFRGSTKPFKYNLDNDSFEKFNSLSEFISNNGITKFDNFATVFDEKQYIYIIGLEDVRSSSDNIKIWTIIRYDIINDSFAVFPDVTAGKNYCFAFLINGIIFNLGDMYNSEYVAYNIIEYSFVKTNKALVLTNSQETEDLYPLINNKKMKLYDKVETAYIGDEETNAKKIDIYKYNELRKIAGNYRKIIFDKNAILANFDNIIDYLTENFSEKSGGVCFQFYNPESTDTSLPIGDSYILVITFDNVDNNGISLMVVSQTLDITFSMALNRDGTLTDTSFEGCWLEGDTAVIEFSSENKYIPLPAGEPIELFEDIAHDPEDLAKLNFWSFDKDDDTILGAWKSINNASDPFELENTIIYLNEDKPFPVINKFNWNFSYENITSDLTINDSNSTINGGTEPGEFNLAITGFSQEYNSTYEKSCTITVKNAIIWDEIPDQTITIGADNPLIFKPLDYYTNKSSGDVEISATSTNENISLNLENNNLIIIASEGAVNSTITITAKVYNIEYSAEFNLIIAS